MEKEGENGIPFLDVHVENKDGRISTRVHRKATHTDRYINYSSHHHPRIKIGVIQCLRDRAENICDSEHARMEKKYLKKVFQANGYPQNLIHKELYRHKQPQATREETEQEEKPKRIFLPYVQRISEHIQRVCRRIGVKAVFKSQGTLRGTLTKVKTPQPELMKKSVVYRVPCLDCDGAYIGETGRNLQKRLTEHKYAAKRGNMMNGIAAHVMEHKHEVDWDGAEVVKQEPRYWKRRVLEAIEIKRHTRNTNLDCGLKLDPICMDSIPPAMT